MNEELLKTNQGTIKDNLTNIIKTKVVGQDKSASQYHQAILDVFFDETIIENINITTYEEIIARARDINDIYALAILLGKYNQQVLNGGHDQYFFNGYSHSYNNELLMDLHDQLLVLVEECYPNVEIKDKLLNVLSDFSVDTYHNDCSVCGGAGMVAGDICYECGGSGEELEIEYAVNDSYELDKRYSKISAEVLFEFEKELQRKLN